MLVKVSFSSHKHHPIATKAPDITASTKDITPGLMGTGPGACPHHAWSQALNTRINNLAYPTGPGAKTSQGLGMVEKEYGKPSP